MKKWKHLRTTIYFFLTLSLVLVSVNEVIRYKQPYGIIQYEGFYEQEKGSIDVLFMGTSHVYCNIDPAYIYDETGILSYDLATGGAGIWNTYYSFKQALEYQKPKVIVVEIFGAVRGDYQLTQREIVDATYSLRNPFIKYDSLKTVCDDTQNSIFEFWLAFPWYHTLYSDIDKFDFSDYSNVIHFGGNNYTYLYPNENPEAYKGATILSTTRACEPAIDARNIADADPLTDKAAEYIQKIIYLAKENEIPVCFLSSPFQGLSDEMQRKVNYINHTICIENECEFIDANCYIEEIGIDWSTDAGDAGHLNYKGSEKFSRWLSQILSLKYGLENKKGTEYAESWDENLKWQNEVITANNLTKIINFTDYISNLENENYLVFVSFYGNNYTEYSSLLVTEANVDGYVIDGEQRFLHYVNTPQEMIFENKKESFMLTTVSSGSRIYHNGQIITNGSTEGIEIVVYDKWLNNIVDTVYFTGSELTATR